MDSAIGFRNPEQQEGLGARTPTHKNRAVPGYLHSTGKLTATLMLRCNISFVLWQVYTWPSISCVMFSFSSSEDTVPPHSPALEELFVPGRRERGREWEVKTSDEPYGSHDVRFHFSLVRFSCRGVGKQWMEKSTPMVWY